MAILLTPCHTTTALMVTLLRSAERRLKLNKTWVDVRFGAHGRQTRPCDCFSFVADVAALSAKTPAFSFANSGATCNSNASVTSLVSKERLTLAANELPVFSRYELCWWSLLMLASTDSHAKAGNCTIRDPQHEFMVEGQYPPVIFHWIHTFLSIS